MNTPQGKQFTVEHGRYILFVMSSSTMEQRDKFMKEKVEEMMEFFEFSLKRNAAFDGAVCCLFAS